jgi:hypothetical protein
LEHHVARFLAGWNRFEDAERQPVGLRGIFGVDILLGLRRRRVRNVGLLARLGERSS